jgi:hypothetical protein
MPAAQIFISYRRDDTAGYARAVYEALSRSFGADRIFIDVDDIVAGLPFDEAIHQAVGQSEVLLVLIGPRWLAGQAGGPSRLMASDDFVRLEVAGGLARGMRVIPLLFDGAAMPTEAQLPEPLRPLARRQALVIDATRFAADTERLVAVLREALDEPATDATSPPPALAPPPAPSTAGRRTALMGVALAAAAGLGVLAWRAGTSTRPKRADAAASATRAARAAINGRWQADVSYDWPNAHYTERFEFSGEGTALQGSASFLRVDRGILEGRVDSDGLAFVTRTRETLGGDGPGQEITHRYLGQLDGDELRFVMQTEGGSSAHRPVSFVARRAGS